MAEHAAYIRGVTGSSPVLPTYKQALTILLVGVFLILENEYNEFQGDSGDSARDWRDFVI